MTPLPYGTSEPVSFPRRGYEMLIRAGSFLQSAVLLLIRLAWGWELVEAGHGHLSNVPDTAANFRDWHIPFPTFNVYLAGGTEMIGGALLMLGLASRLICIPLFFNFCVAYLTASHDKVVHFFHQSPDKIIDDSAFPFLVTSLLILAFGPGKASLDYLLQRLVFHKRDVVDQDGTGVPGASQAPARQWVPPPPPN